MMMTQHIAQTPDILHFPNKTIKIEKEDKTLSLFSTCSSLSDFENHKESFLNSKAAPNKDQKNLKNEQCFSSERNTFSKNGDRLSIHSCATQLYDPFDYSPIQASVNNSTYTIQSDEHVVFNIPTWTSSQTVQLITKRKSTAENSYQKKKKIYSSDGDVVLILNKTAVRDYSKIIIEPPNFKLIKRIKRNDGKSKSVKLQCKITGFLKKIEPPKSRSSVCASSDENDCAFVSAEADLKSGVLEIHNYVDERIHKKSVSTKQMDHKPGKCQSVSGTVHRKSAASTSYTVSTRSVSKPSSTTPLPPHKLIQGTQFAVDAFCYGAIPDVNTYFLTHFHSDHYMGLRKTFNNTLYCSKITADLCILKLCINPRCIKIINPGETLLINEVEVTALDANHCPGSIMLVFSLHSGMNILHCGDFRATHAMESLPIFWNNDIHTIYLDTTYCNPRYNFPTQDESIEMAVNVLTRKKIEFRKKNKDFSKVLIVCGTYTIGKENFFLRLSGRMECGVWAAAEKDRVLRAVLGRSFSAEPSQRCQLHVLDMKCINYRDLKGHLDSQNGAFSEVVAFKPSGWENGKSAALSDNICIHGIPYSEHSSFSEMVRFVQFLKPKLVIPTVPISGGIKSVQKYFPCPLAFKDDRSQKKISDYFVANKISHAPAIT